jgi:hypothetical protein
MERKNLLNLKMSELNLESSQLNITGLKRIGPVIREGYTYDQTLRAHVSEKKLVDFAEFSYSTEDGSKFKRNLKCFFLKKATIYPSKRNGYITVR